MISAKNSIRNYLGYNGIDNCQRTLDQTLLWDDEMLEHTHDFIQWWFPLDEPSAFNSHAPVVSRAEFEELGGGQACKSRGGAHYSSHVSFLRFVSGPVRFDREIGRLGST